MQPHWFPWSPRCEKAVYSRTHAEATRIEVVSGARMVFSQRAKRLNAGPAGKEHST